MYTKEEINNIDIQLVALFIILITDIVSIITTYNQKLDLEDKETLLESNELYKLTLHNRELILILSLVFLYVNYRLYNISKKKGEDLKSYILQIIASILVVASCIIALYVVKLSDKNNIVDIENPII